MRLFAIAGAIALFGFSDVHADPAAFRAIYKTLVETDTTLASGSCTLASQRMVAAMTGAGFPVADLHLYATPEHPKDGGLVAVLKGADPKAKAVLFVAHVDVVAADRADWATDPFQLVEADGYFHGRGVSDDKAMAAALVESLIRLHQEKFHAPRDIKVALTCGEESATAFNGAQYLSTDGRNLADAELALVPSGGGALDDKGKPVSLTIQAGEKVQQNFRLIASGIGSHASRPTKDNAIYILAGALTRLSAYNFPVELNQATRLYFSRIAEQAEPDQAAAIRRLLAEPSDAEAQKVVTANTAWNAYLRTTCVATIVETGAQANTVAPRAAATVNCRLLPGAKVADVQETLKRLVSDPAVTITALPPLSPTPTSPPMTPKVLKPVEAAAQAVWPGVHIVPAMLTGATDARHFNAAGIPAYGVTAVFNNPDGDGVHAPNERVRVSAVYEGREFIYRLMKLYADGE